MLIASYPHFYEMLAYLQSIGHERIYDVLELILLEYDESVLSEPAMSEKHNPGKYRNVVEHADAAGVLVHVDLTLTERCSLRCRDCSNLIPHYRHPENLDAAEIIRCFDRFLDAVDMLLDVRLIGGEPFLYNDIDVIIRRYAENDKIKQISIYTNSTVIPSGRVIESLKNDKVFVHMSDYGQTSSRLAELDRLLTDNGVKHYVHGYEVWYDLGGTHKRNHEEAHLKSIYKNCIMSACNIFYRGKFYMCPRAAHGEAVGLYRNPESEYVDFTKDIDAKTAREKLRKLIEDTEYITACDYCDGQSTRFSAIVPPAVQLER